MSGIDNLKYTFTDSKSLKINQHSGGKNHSFNKISNHFYLL